MKKLIALFLIASMATTFVACSTSDSEETQPTTQQETEPETQPETQPQNVQLGTKGEYELAATIENGAILHAWCWSFDTIKENMEDIAKAGYTSIQTSPINEVKVGENGGMQIQDTEDSQNNGKWYYHYQPTDYEIGNYQLGTEEEFTAMCDEADKYGISIIVDAVVNHMTGDRMAISDDFYEDIEGEPFHSNGDILDFNDREQLTQNVLLGLADLNTQNESVQEYILDFLKDCVEAGADGFRYDAMKHVELSDDDSAYASDFWNVVLDNGAEFQYGEILQGGADRGSSYVEQLDVSMTASKYGESIRYSVLNRDLSTAIWKNYSANVDESKLVTWVESHDNYCNDSNYAHMDDQGVKWSWALITARSGGTPLFFSRPAGADTENQWGNNVIGEAGSDLYKDAEVVAVNQFRNHMAGLDETLSNPMDNDEIAMIERGDKGAVIVYVNDEDSATLKDVDTVLADGTYKDKVTGSEFTVKDGKLSGELNPSQIVTLY